MGVVYADMLVPVHDVRAKGGREVVCAIALEHAGAPMFATLRVREGSPQGNRTVGAKLSVV